MQCIAPALGMTVCVLDLLIIEMFIDTTCVVIPIDQITLYDSWTLWLIHLLLVIYIQWQMLETKYPWVVPYFEFLSKKFKAH